MVLGAASWLGYLLINRLVSSGYPVSGSLYQQQPEFGTDNLELFFATTPKDYVRALEQRKPDFVVNFLRGEDEQGLEIHKTIINYCHLNGAVYLYASSVLALDAYENIPLTEDLKAHSLSPYGIFKAKCEELLQVSRINYTILRFASVQGWVPHKITRNEAFLQKLAKGQVVTVDRGVVQNRMPASVLIRGIVDIIKKRITGILHFGSTDASEEFHFLQKQAVRFGYPIDFVQGGSFRRVNLVAVPNRIFQELGQEYRQSEEATLEYLCNIPGLIKYKVTDQQQSLPNEI